MLDNIEMHDTNGRVPDRKAEQEPVEQLEPGEQPERDSNEGSTDSKKSDLFYDERWAVQKHTNFYGIGDENVVGIDKVKTLGD